jgi:glycosyltransferase involved in cell wall biosynthesis
MTFLHHDNTTNTPCKSPEDVLFVFLGAVVPIADASSYPGYSVAGNLWQMRLLTALTRNSFLCSKILSARPVPSFPRIRKIWFSSNKAEVENGFSVRFLPFINMGALKTATLGLAAFLNLLKWGWHQRHITPKVIIIYNVNAPHGLFTVLAARILRTKVFAVIADLPVPGHGIIPRTPMRCLDYFLQVKSLPRFDGLIVLTRSIARDFAPQVPFIHMEGAVDPQKMALLDGCSEQKHSPQFVVMYAGVLSEFDGIPLLLNAFSLLEGHHYRLLIVGKGPQRTRVEQAVKNDSRISYLGFLPHEQVVGLYRQADLLVNPRPSPHLSTRYVFPSKLIEYLATGKPVITTATADVVEEYGSFVFLLRDETPKGLADLICQVAALQETERLASGETARRYVLNHKTWDVQGQRVADFIRAQLRIR